MVRKSDFIYGDMLSEDCYIVAYHSNKSNTGEEKWNPPKNSAVQLAAAITASARIYMYPYISRDDCYYTDTDSVALGSSLPEDLISSTVLGKFKLEDRIVKGYFLAPKAYCYTAIEGKNVLKYKGPAKNLILPEWFEKQYADPSRTEQVTVEANFRIDWHTLHIFKKKTLKTLYKLGIKEGSKRVPVYKGDTWVDTDPHDVNDLSCLDHIGMKIIKSLRSEIIHQQIENQFLVEKLTQMEEKLKQFKQRDKEIR